jgi:hypothetical protein
VKSSSVTSRGYDVVVEARRPAEVGDKVTGRHGNKGVISLILPDDEMPYMRGSSGEPTRIELILNPMGVVSRMNIGQLLETHYGWLLQSGLCADRQIGEPFRPVNLGELRRLLAEAGLPEGKAELLLRRQGQEVSLGRGVVGYQYVSKLDHLARDKLRARAGGKAYDRVLNQPRKEGTEGGAQRFGEMEVWALLAHGAKSILQEFMTVRSDDRWGRRQVLEAARSATDPLLDPVPTRSLGTLRTLQWYLRGLGIETEPSFEGRRPPPSTVRHRLATAADIRGWTRSCEKPRVSRWQEIVQCLNEEDRASNCGDRPPKLHAHYIELSWRMLSPHFFGSPGRLRRFLGQGRLDEVMQGVEPAILRIVERLKESRRPSRATDAELRRRALSHILNYQWFLDERPGANDGNLQARLSNGYLINAMPRGDEPRGVPIVDFIIDQLTDDEKAQCTLTLLPMLPCAFLARSFYTWDLYKMVWSANRKISSPDRTKRSQGILSLYWALSRLFYRGERSGRKVIAESISQPMEGDAGLLRFNLQGRRLDYSGRAVIVPDPALSIDECSLPAVMMAAFFEEALTKRLMLEVGPERCRQLVRDVLAGEPADSTVLKALERIIDDRQMIVLLNRQPTLHKYNLLAFHPRVRRDFVMGIPPLVCSGFNADFDGDTMAIYLIFGNRSRSEARALFPSRNLFRVANGAPSLHLVQDIRLGLHILGNELRQGGPRPRVPTQIGLGQLSPADHLAAIAEMCRQQEVERVKGQLKEIQDIAFEVATKRADRSSFGVYDLVELAEALANRDGRGDPGKGARKEAVDDDAIEAALKACPRNPITSIVTSGARGNVSQVANLIGEIGTVIYEDETPAPLPIRSNFLGGLQPLEYWMLAHPTRRTMLDKKLTVGSTGELSRVLTEGAYDIVVDMYDCGTAGRLPSRRPRGIPNALWEQVVARQPAILGAEIGGAAGIRSPLLCWSPRGICQLCYGLDPATGQLPTMGTAVGIIAAQSVGERGTQETMRTFHTRALAPGWKTFWDLFCEGKLPQEKRNDVILGSGAGLSEDQLKKLWSRTLPPLYSVYKEAVSPVHIEVLLAALVRAGRKTLRAAASDSGRRGALAAAVFTGRLGKLVEAAIERRVLVKEEAVIERRVLVKEQSFKTAVLLGASDSLGVACHA